MDDLLQEMIDPAPTQHDRARRRRMWTTAAIVGLAAIGVTSLTTSAVFSDRERSGAAINTGTLDLKANTKLTFTMPVSNMLPGARVYAPVTIKNDGSLAFEYAAKVTADAQKGAAADNPSLGNGDTPNSADLPDMLRLDLYSADSDTCDSSVAQTANLVGRTPGTWGIGTDQKLFGSPTANAAGNRTLSADATEYFCVRVTFNKAAENEYQNTAAQLTLTFDAVQQDKFEDGDDTSQAK